MKRYKISYESILINNTYLVHNVFEVCETPKEIRIINSFGEVIVSLPPNTKWEVKEGKVKGWDKKSQAWKIEPYYKYRVQRVAYPATETCTCFHTEPITVWEGNNPANYEEGLGCFDEGCHSVQRWMERWDSKKQEWVAV